MKLAEKILSLLNEEDNKLEKVKKLIDQLPLNKVNIVNTPQKVRDYLTYKASAKYKGKDLHLGFKFADDIEVLIMTDDQQSKFKCNTSDEEFHTNAKFISEIKKELGKL